jgi:divalent metal cation (Fe/Co/Zn/Cd) transporter
MLLLAGVLVVADGLVAGAHAFGFGRYSVAGIVVAGMLLMVAGASILRETRRPV